MTQQHRPFEPRTLVLGPHALAPEAALRAGVIVCAILAVALSVTTRALAGSPDIAQRSVGHAAPQVALPAVQDGRMLSAPVPLVAQPGRPTLLVFTHSLCPHCLGQVQAVRQLQSRSAALGLQVTYIDSPAEATRIVAAYQQRLAQRDPILLDANAAVAQRLGVSYYPALVVVDRHGVIRFVATGETPIATLQRAVEEAAQ